MKFFIKSMFVGMLIVGLLCMISSVSALESIGTFKNGECVEIKQTCSSCTYVNFSLSYPNSSRILTNQALASQGGGLWTYEYCNNTINGRYEVTGEGDISGTAESFATYYIITPSGSNSMTSGEGFSLFGSLIIIILTGVFFFVMSLRVDLPIAKISMIILSSIIMLISIFYSIVIVQQTLSGFTNIIEGYSTFFFVMKIVASLIFLGFMIFALLVAIRYQKVRRGMID